MVPTQRRDHPTTRRPLEEAELEEVRLVHVLDRVGLLPERHGERGQPNRTAAELPENRVQQIAIRALEPDLVDLEKRERLPGDIERDGAGVPHLRDVPDTAEDPVRDARGP